MVWIPTALESSCQPPLASDTEQHVSPSIHLFLSLPPSPSLYVVLYSSVHPLLFLSPSLSIPLCCALSLSPSLSLHPPLSVALSSSLHISLSLSVVLLFSCLVVCCLQIH